MVGGAPRENLVRAQLERSKLTGPGAPPSQEDTTDDTVKITFFHVDHSRNAERPRRTAVRKQSPSVYMAVGGSGAKTCISGSVDNRTVRPPPQPCRCPRTSHIRAALRAPCFPATESRHRVPWEGRPPRC